MRSYVDSSNLGCSVRHLLGCQVTVDRAKNRTADTGGWELVYRQPLVQQPQYSGISLTVQGTKMTLSQRWAALQHCSRERWWLSAASIMGRHQTIVERRSPSTVSRYFLQNGNFMIIRRCSSDSVQCWWLLDTNRGRVRTDNIVLDETMPYAHSRKLRLTPEADNLQDSSAANLTLPLIGQNSSDLHCIISCP